METTNPKTRTRRYRQPAPNKRACLAVGILDAVGEASGAPVPDFGDSVKFRGYGGVEKTGVVRGYAFKSRERARPRFEVLVLCGNACEYVDVRDVVMPPEKTRPVRRRKPATSYKVYYDGGFMFYARSVSPEKLKATLRWKRGWDVGKIECVPGVPGGG